MIFDSATVETNPDLPPEQPDSASVLQNPNFLFLWLGQIFSQIADKVYLVLIIAIISSQFQQEGERISGWVSSVMVAFTIPAVLFGSIAGVYVDRWVKKWVLVGTNLLRGLLVIAIPLILGLTVNWGMVGTSPAGFVGILAVTFLVSTFTQFFTPAEQSVITLIVDKPKLLAANSICTTTVMGAMILGFAIGEPLLALADHVITLGSMGKELVVGGCYLAAGLILMLMQTGEVRNLQRDEPHIWVDIRDGLNYLGKNRAVQSALLQLVSTFSIIAAMTVLAVRLAEVMPEIKSEQFGFLLADASLGIAIGAVIVGQFGDRLSRKFLALVGAVGMAIFLAGLALVCDRFWLGLAMVGGIGIFAGISVIPMQTLIQEQTPEEMRGKVFGLQNNAINIALSLPLALAGIAESYVGLEVVILSLAAIALGMGLLTWYVAVDT